MSEELPTHTSLGSSEYSATGGRRRKSRRGKKTAVKKSRRSGKKAGRKSRKSRRR